MESEKDAVDENKRYIKAYEFEYTDASSNIPIVWFCRYYELEASMKYMRKFVEFDGTEKITIKPIVCEEEYYNGLFSKLKP